MCLDHIAAFTVSDQATLTGNNRSGQLKLSLEANAILVAAARCDNDRYSIFP